jgi:endonuclease/exonuclease/phosphatase family metal-dependent hydrolase
MAFRVLTLNLWNISEPLAARYRALEAGLKQLRPDIVCLQEVYRDPASGRSQAVEQRIANGGLEPKNCSVVFDAATGSIWYPIIMAWLVISPFVEPQRALWTRNPPV